MPGFAQGHAVLVGIGADLPVTIRDATALSDLLLDPARCAFPSSQVHLLTKSGATRANLLSALDMLAQSARPEDTAVVFFSGHGYRIAPPGQPEAFFLMTYGHDLSDLPNTTVGGGEFTAKLRAIQAKKLLVLLDCCHAGGVAELKLPGMTLANLPLPLQAEEVLAAGSGRVILSSSRADEYSYIGTGYSQFTLALLEALAGAGAAERDGYARVLDVALYVGRMVPNRTGDRQHPIIKVAELADNFAVAYYAAGAKEPLPPPRIDGVQPVMTSIATNMELAEGYRTLLRRYQRNLLEIEMQMAEFIDQRNVPLDLLRAKESVLKRMGELDQEYGSGRIISFGGKD